MCLVKAKCVRVALPCGVSESCICVIRGATVGYPYVLSVGILRAKF